MALGSAWRGVDGIGIMPKWSASGDVEIEGHQNQSVCQPAAVARQSAALCELLQFPADSFSTPISHTVRSLSRNLQSASNGI